MEKRIRTVKNWHIHDWGDGEYSIIGFVIKSNMPNDEETTRITRTSPIQYRIGNNIVITRSGSQYTLDAPNKTQDINQIIKLFDEQ